MDLHKINVKVTNGTTNSWVHFCYVPLELKMEFDEYMRGKNKEGRDWVKEWARQDFDMKFGEIMDEVDLLELRKRIKDRYQELYPELYIDSVTDNQGWSRVWYTTNMKNEMTK